ncbi:UvrD-helicase domain-containing protein [Paenibacillus athensensis]|uniref:ATP-dependent helicase/nuclease subunit A n=1 Tax=Paenibacillus athensensis TaxID=1967502 RepID=A0A4Y8PRR4_9BACL|nr:UvrD-helicase domain-containing protein [Paenibacillus athensensis]MCD1261589.1 UvrD-helicase domain-containing protein [Paenibacillus athensensis]
MSMQQQPKPLDSTWTDDQWDAITLAGRNMLVAAAAGSGKTAVLVERIIRRIASEQQPVDVDRLLVATFTKAAASEMKHRIRDALEKELLRQPRSQHLRKQLALMGRASITTLHSFCLEVVQRYFSLIRLDPGFRIANETEAELLRQDLLEELLESYYAASESESSSPFWRLVDAFSGERSDAALMQLVQKLYDVSRSHPWPDQWLREAALMFGPQPEAAAERLQEAAEAGSPLAEAEAAAELEAAWQEAAAAMETDRRSDAPEFAAWRLNDAASAKLDGEAAAAPVDFSRWEASLVADVQLELTGAADVLRQAQELAEQPGGPTPYLANLSDDLQLIGELLTASRGPWSDLHARFQTAEFGKLKACKGDDYDKQLQEQVKELRNRAKEQVGKIREELFGRTMAQFAQEVADMAPLLHTLVDLVCDFAGRYQQAKAAKGLIDFADLEHYCLQILREPGAAPGQLVPSQAALAYREQFVEVLLDEYQDTNRVQEAIVELISRPGAGNRFMVGDVKQSIYRFRLAEPGLFLEKYKAYARDVAASGLRIDLARNFRSRRQVVDAVNFLFRQLMNEGVGEIAYDERAELIYGAGYPEAESDCAVEMVLIDRSVETGEAEDEADRYTEEEDGGVATEGAGPSDLELEAQELETVQLEARAMAAQIRRLLGGDAPADGTKGQQAFQVFDKRVGGMRPATYRDIVILLRATQMWAPVIIEEFKHMGIPAYADLSTGYFSATEVEVMLSLLKIIDNPYQDIPLAAVLRSPVVLLNADELARIRAVGKGQPFYEALLRAAKGGVEPDEADTEAAAGAEAADSGQAAGASGGKGFAGLEPAVAGAGERADGKAGDCDTPGQESPDDAASEPDELVVKLRRFLEQLELWRSEARQGSLADLIWRIYRETGYYDFVGGLPGGVQRQANLRALYDRARQYESTSLRGLFRFLRFLERMQETGGDLGTARSLGEQEDVVRIMSIHKSKGLEFPVVFVAGMAKSFNQRDLNDAFLLHKELGFGPRFIDTELRVGYPSLPSLAIKRRMKLELLAEEMRVLYVALTRAREKLILLGTVKSLNKLLGAWSRHLAGGQPHLPDYELARAKCYLDWVGPALLRHPAAEGWRQRLDLPGNANALLADASEWTFTVLRPQELLAPTAPAEEPNADEAQSAAAALAQSRLEALRQLAPVPSSGIWRERLEQRLSWQYAYAEAPAFFAKTTVSEMKRLADRGRITAEEELPSAVFGLGREPAAAPSVLRRPRFLEQRRLTAAEKGTVVHAVMQNLPLVPPPTADSIRELLASMLERQMLTCLQAESVEPEAILRFFATDLGRRMLLAPRLRREVPFSYGLDASEVYVHAGPSAAGETVLIQGVIDCLFEDDQGLVLLDYKTDAVRGSSPDELRERYRVQIGLYAQAVAHIWRRPLSGAYLYFFDGEILVEMDVPEEERG